MVHYRARDLFKSSQLALMSDSENKYLIGNHFVEYLARRIQRQRCFEDLDLSRYFHGDLWVVREFSRFNVGDTKN